MTGPEMSKDEAPEYTPSPSTNLKLHIKDARKVYTNGDNIAGEVVLQVSEKSIPVSQILVRLTCVLYGLQGQIWTTYLDHQEDVLRLHKSSEKGIAEYGVHALAFRVSLDNKKVSHCPPTASDPTMGFELRWSLVADAFHGTPPKRFSKLSCETRVHIEPVVEKNFKQKYAPLCRTLFCNSQAHIRSIRAGPLKVTLRGLSTNLPRPPATFDLEVEAVPRKSFFLVSIALELHTHVWTRFDCCKPNTNHSQHIELESCNANRTFKSDMGSATFNRDVRARECLKVSMRGCCLTGHRFPAAFSTQGFRITHKLLFKVDTMSGSHSESFSSDVASPRHMSKSQTAKTAALGEIREAKSIDEDLGPLKLFER